MSSSDLSGAQSPATGPKQAHTHSQSNAVPCPNCNKKFGSTKSLDQHFRNTHAKNGVGSQSAADSPSSSGNVAQSGSQSPEQSNQRAKNPRQRASTPNAMPNSKSSKSSYRAKGQTASTGAEQPTTSAMKSSSSDSKNSLDKTDSSPSNATPSIVIISSPQENQRVDSQSEGRNRRGKRSQPNNAQPKNAHSKNSGDQEDQQSRNQRDSRNQRQSNNENEKPRGKSRGRNQNRRDNFNGQDDRPNSRNENGRQNNRNENGHQHFASQNRSSSRPQGFGGRGGQAYFPEYMSLEDARKEVAAGRAWEGILRANPHAQKMCFFTIPGRSKDVLIKDDWLNRAFGGDRVIIKMLSDADWQKEEKFQTRRENQKKGRSSNRSKTPEPSSESGLLDVQEKEKQTRSASTLGIRSHQDGKPAVDDVNDDDERTGSNDRLGNDHSSNIDFDRKDLEVDLKDLSISGEKATQDDDNNRLDIEMLDKNHHANFDISQFDGRDPEDKQKSDLAKVICIVDPHHKKVGFVGRLMLQDSGMAELRPLSLQYPVFDVPLPKAVPVEPKKTDATSGSDPTSSNNASASDDEESTEQSSNSKFNPNDLYITYFDSWDRYHRRPLGVAPVLVGRAGDVRAESEAITATYMIDTTPFSADLTSQFNPVFAVEDKEIPLRKDLRKERVFTVDPPTAKDIDDALSIEKIGPDRYRVGVHIADVSHYVTPGTELDKLAQQRSTSVYMVNTMYPMLPPILSENLCSLNPKVDRYAMSVIWEMDGEGNEYSQWIGKTIVRSCVKLSYIDAQKVIDGDAANELQPALDHLASLKPEHDPKDIAQDILYLNKIAQTMRDKRFEGGALRLSRLRLHFDLGPDGYPTAAYPYLIKESNQLIEEFMLLANMTVAKFIYKAFPKSALLRNHPEPKQDQLAEFGHLMKALGIPFDSSTSGDLYKSLSKLEDWQRRPVEELVTKAMNAATYICTGNVAVEQELWHYALNVPFYTHYTSPIRRYPDIVVHRQIMAALESASKPGQAQEYDPNDLSWIDPTKDIKWVTEVSAHSNERKTSARRAQEDSINLFACLFLKQKPFVDEESLVLDVTRNQIVVFSPTLCCRLKIALPTKKGFTVKYDANKRIISVLDNNNNKSLLVATYFSKVSVTYFTQGALPMKIAGDLTIWFKEGQAKNPTPETTETAPQIGGNGASQMKKKRKNKPKRRADQSSS